MGALTGARNLTRPLISMQGAALSFTMTENDGSLARALAVQRRAAAVGFDWPDASGPITKINEESQELEREIRETGKGKRGALEEELGDLLFAVVNLARKLAIDPATALERANEKFERRFGAVERLAVSRGIDLGRASLEALDELWEEVKGGKGR